MRARLIEFLTRFLCWLSRGRRLRPGPGVAKVNMGCGLQVAPGWINLDGSLNSLCAALPPAALKLVYRLTGAREFFTEAEYIRILKGHRFVHHDVRYGLPFPDGSLDFLYSSHFLEHLYRDEAEALLREAHRVLKPDGTLRTCVPDLEHAFRLYREGKKEHALDQYFFTRSKDHQFLRHKYMYDFEILSAFLKKAGFSRIERRAFRSGATPDLELLDNRADETLFVEASK
jgi:predicted SAM-dependent methyltransferase